MTQYAIRFEFDTMNQGKTKGDYSLKKEVGTKGAAVVYLAMACPVYYELQGDRWKELGETAPTYKLQDDSLIFVFNDKAASSPSDVSAPKVSACGVSIEFAQGLAPFDDDVTASIRMTATNRRSDFPIVGGPCLRVFVLDWSASLQNQPPRSASVESFDEAFRFESKGKFDYTVSLLTFFEGGKADPKRYWQDPEMDIGN